MTSDFFSAVDSRRAVRNFLPDPIPSDVLSRCIDAALKAPSSSNLQPWEFVIFRDPVKRAAANAVCLGQQSAMTAPLLVAIVAHGETWRRNSREILRVHGERGTLQKSQRDYWGRKIPLAYRTGPFGWFGLLKVMSCRLVSVLRATNSLLSRADLRVVVNKSTALAAATFMLALRAEGYDSCPIEGFDPWRARRLLKLHPKAEVCMFIAIGLKGQGGVASDRILMPREWLVREV